MLVRRREHHHSLADGLKLLVQRIDLPLLTHNVIFKLAYRLPL